jgi:hypothetical protein
LALTVATEIENQKRAMGDTFTKFRKLTEFYGQLFTSTPRKNLKATSVPIQTT